MDAANGIHAIKYYWPQRRTFRVRIRLPRGQFSQLSSENRVPDFVVRHVVLRDDLQVPHVRSFYWVAEGGGEAFGCYFVVAGCLRCPSGYWLCASTLSRVEKGAVLLFTALCSTLPCHVIWGGRVVASVV